MFEFSELKERQFIKQSAKKWKNFEHDIKGENRNPQNTSKLFVQITDDLSYARTFYPNRMVRKYLDGVSQVLLQRITKAERSSLSSFMKFWLQTLPLALYKSRRALTVSAILFLCSMAIGILSSMYEPDFARIILGESYVTMTEANIENEDPMAVYKEFNEFDGFLDITVNNIRVALITFMSGILYAVGSVLVLISNGIMVGAFQYFFIERGLFWESFLTIWQHGTLEISAIIIAGGAGITMGKGLIYPKFYSRLQSFKISGKQGLVIFLGTVPLFIIAGFIEGFLTRATDLAPFIRIMVIIISLLFILYYYSWYPRFVYKNTPKAADEEADQLPAEKRTVSELKSNVIYSSNELLRASYSFCTSNSGFMWIGMLISVLLSYLMIGELDWSYLTTEAFVFSWTKNYFGFITAANSSAVITSVLGVSVLFLSILAHYLVDKKRLSFFSYFSLHKLAIAGSLGLTLLHPLFMLVVIIMYLVFIQTASNTLAPWIKEKPEEPSLGEHFGGSLGIVGMVSGVNLIVLLCLIIFNSLLFSDIAGFFTEDSILQEKLSYGVTYFIWLLYMFSSHFIISAGNHFVFNSEKEKTDAEGLKTRIQEFKLKYGLQVD